MMRFHNKKLNSHFAQINARPLLEGSLFSSCYEHPQLICIKRYHYHLLPSIDIDILKAQLTITEF